MGKDKKAKGDRSIMSETDSPAEQALILVCEKCGRKVSEKGEDFAYDLQKILKHAGAERFGKHQIRTVTTSCFDICPKGRVVACVVPVAQKLRDDSASRPRFFEIETSNPRKAEAAIMDCLEELGVSPK